MYRLVFIWFALMVAFVWVALVHVECLVFGFWVDYACWLGCWCFGLWFLLLLFDCMTALH